MEKGTAPLHPIRVLPGFWRMVGVDLVGPLRESREGYRYILSVVDYFTKWPEFVPLKSKSALEVARAIFGLQCRHGVAEIHISDNGTEFVNKLMRKLLKISGTRQRVTSPYHPQTNGMVERQNRTVQEALRKCITEQNQRNWPYYLEPLAYALRQKKNRATGLSPFEMIHGRAMKLPVDNMHDEIPSDTEEIPDLSPAEVDALESKCTPETAEEVGEFVNYLREKVFSKALHNIEQEQFRMEEYRERLRDMSNSLEIGNRVWIANLKQRERKGGKYDKKWKGPYTIVEQTSNGNFVLQESDGHNLKGSYPAEQLMLYRDRDEFFPPDADMRQCFVSDDDLSDDEDFEYTTDEEVGFKKSSQVQPTQESKGMKRKGGEKSSKKKPSTPKAKKAQSQDSPRKSQGFKFSCRAKKYEDSRDPTGCKVQNLPAMGKEMAAEVPSPVLQKVMECEVSNLPDKYIIQDNASDRSCLSQGSDEVFRADSSTEEVMFREDTLPFKVDEVDETSTPFKSYKKENKVSTPVSPNIVSSDNEEIWVTTGI